MLKGNAMRKKVIVHIGPHKTGSTAIQRCLSDNRKALESEGVMFIHGSITHDAAILLAREEYDSAEKSLQLLNDVISASDEKTFILSQEDFCGDLPGRSRKKNIYPRLTKNLRTINRALREHNVIFAFFVREEADWLMSCYHQHLKYRTSFSSFESFSSHFDEVLDWSRKLEKPKETFGGNLVILPYNKANDSGVNAILHIAGIPNLKLSHPPLLKNKSPDIDKTKLLERINALSSFKQTAWFSKSLVLNEWKPNQSECISKPDVSSNSHLASIALPLLTQRALNRISRQEVEDILPDEASDFSSYVFDVLPTDVELPAVSRAEMRNQSRILDYHLRGKSKLAKLNALTISYLRRDTDYTGKAAHIFHRIWREYGHIMINELTTRWLISTLQTFLDHGENEGQRLIGAAGHFYANMMKIYEGERAIEALEQDATYTKTSPQTLNKFSGLDRYSVGGTDLLLNTNALAADLGMRDDVAGLVLFELLLRTKHSGNVFTRMDNTRKEKEIVVPGFSNTWSFFDPPQ